MLDVDAIPPDLTRLDQWVCWAEVERDGKATKVPKDPRVRANASVTDPDTWASFETALERYEDDDAIAGIGFVFTTDDPFVGIDLDSCRDPLTGEPYTWAKEVIDQLYSYTEVSPSGTGYHIYVRGELPEGGNRAGDIECYETSRFFTVTGEHVDGLPKSVADREHELREVHIEYISGRTTVTPSSSTSSGAGPLDDTTLIRKAMAAQNGEKFARLWRGDTSGYDSHSEADMALSCMLAFWTAHDATQMDRLFRDSGLYREKWDTRHYGDGRTYGEGTIDRAIAHVSETYDPGASTDAASPEGNGTAESDFGTADPVGLTIHTSVTADGGDADSDAAALFARLDTMAEEIASLQAHHDYLYEQLQAERERRRHLETRLSDLLESKSKTPRSLRTRLFGGSR